MLHLQNAKRKTEYFPNNKGFSIVELIIVIAIIAVLGTGAMFSISLIFSSNAKACANSLKTAIADCKVTTMGKEEAWMEIYRGSNQNVYYQIHTKKNGVEEIKDPEKIGGDRVYLQYTDAAGTSAELTTSGSHIIVAFDRATGSFTDATCKSIEIIGGTRHYTLTFTKLTGKVTTTVTVN